LFDSDCPFFIKLYCTFQDETRLYFTMNYCPNGELLTLINQREIFDEQASLFYAAEIILALEHLHRLGIVHRDLKPENILLNEKMHIQLTDFGSALFLNVPSNENDKENYRNRKNSFVGTAQYVSPEMLTNKKITPMCDLWAFACILFQMLTDDSPFSCGNEYQIFQKIQNLEYKIPDAFPSYAKNLIESLLKLDSTERLGANDDLSASGYESIRNHPYFSSIQNWDLSNQDAPAHLLSVATKKTATSNELNSEPGLTERHIARMLGLALYDDTNQIDEENEEEEPTISVKGLFDISLQELEGRLTEQKKTNKYHQFVENNLIVKQGLVDKKKGFFPRRRMFLLTTGPRLYYVDPQNMVLKGQVPLSKEMRIDAKNFRNFYIHVPNRTYILEDTTNSAPAWCEALEEVKKHISQIDSGESAVTDAPEASTSSASDSNCSNSDSLKIARKSSSKNSLFNIHIRKIGLIEKTN